MSITVAGCELCETPGGEILHQGRQFRVVLVDDALYLGFCRVIWTDHVKEVTDLNELDRMLLMDVLWQVEHVVREVMQPEKINLASFGNMVPHLHWHIIARWQDDKHFPQAVWAVAPEATEQAKQLLANRREKTVEQMDAYHQALIHALNKPQ